MIIYTITNNINGKKYVGQTIQPPSKRWNAHIYKTNSGSQLAIHNAMRKYGIDNFTFKIVKECNSIVELNNYEIYLIETLDTFHGAGYNMDEGGGGIKGYHHTDNAKQKISEAGKGRTLSDEAKQKISEKNSGKNNGMYGKCGELNHFYGKKHSKEVVENMSTKVIQLTKDGKIIKEYSSITEASRQTGVNKSCICNVCKGKKQRKSAGGFIWKYK